MRRRTATPAEPPRPTRQVFAYEKTIMRKVSAEKVYRAKQFLKKAIAIGGELADVVIAYKARPTPLGLALIGARGFSIWLNAAEDNELACLEGWKIASNTHAITAQILRLITSRSPEAKLRNVSAEGGNFSIFMLDTPVGTFGFYGGAGLIAETCDDDDIVGPYIEAPTDEIYEAKISVLRNFMWDLIAGNSFVLAKGEDGACELVVEPTGDAESSDIADHYAERCRPFLEAGLTQGLLFWGDPGSGKSTACRRIVHLLGGRAVRMPAHNMGSARSVAATVIKFLQPTGLIIDDIDRTSNPEGVLETLDALRRTPGLGVILASANNLNRLDTAARRPGRFDDIIEIQATETVSRKILGEAGATPETIEKLCKIPVVYAVRYAELVKHLGDTINVAEEVERVWQVHEAITKTTCRGFDDLSCDTVPEEKLGEDEEADQDTQLVGRARALPRRKWEAPGQT